MANKPKYYEVELPFPAGLLGRTWTVSEKTLEELKKTCAETRDQLRYRPKKDKG